MKYIKYFYIFIVIIISQSSYSAYTCGIDANVVLQTNLDDYPSTICASLGGNNCLVQETHSEKTSSGWTVYATSTGEACGSLTVLNKPTLPDDNCIRDPDGSIRCPEKPVEPEPDPVLKCTTDSCVNPDNKRCPSGYVSGSFNGQRLCMKSEKKPEEPTDGSEETNAIIDAKDSIVGAIGDLSASLSDSLNRIYDLLKDKLKSDGETPNTGDGETPNGGVDTSGLEADLPIKPIVKKDFKENLFSSSAKCPPDNTLSMNFLGRNFTHTFKYSSFCDGLSIIGFFIIIMCYLYASHIVIRA